MKNKATQVKESEGLTLLFFPFTCYLFWHS